MLDAMDRAIANPEQYIKENRESMERYMQWKQSDEYRESIAYRLSKALQDFQEKSGYNTIFIPAMKRLSPAYRRHHDELIKANHTFLLSDIK